MSGELLPCPFCNGAGGFVKHSAGIRGTMGFDSWDAVACKSCGGTVGASDRRFRNRDDAAKAWNTRATPPQAKPAGPVQDVRMPQWQLPEMNPDLHNILGRMCFQCINLAKLLRAGGHTIKTRAEDEQAAVIHFLLGHYIKHGENWSKEADKELKAMHLAYIEQHTAAHGITQPDGGKGAA